MSDFRRIRRQQILREAEGYLDLIMVLSDRWAPSQKNRDALAERAIGLLSRIDEPSIRRADVCFLQGQALRAMEKYCEAIEPLTMAAELDGENISIWLALAWCQKRCGRLDLAIQALEEALLIDEDQALIYFNLACYWSLAKNAKLALTYLAHALDIDPDFRDLIAAESDFDPIRDHPDFQMLTSVIV